jgi:hypothetical protein
VESAETGRTLGGRYRLDAVIGRGGMGVVWRARDGLLERDVAVKELVWPPDFTEAEQETACQRAVREAQMAGRLAHLNVVRIYDILQEDSHPWIIMELLPYPSLRDLVRTEGPLTPAQAARVGLGVLAALRAAHAEGVLHRDVKPANILVGPDGRVVLTDFGIARAGDSPPLTASGTLVGSPAYIAPERARGGQARPAGDLWGLGASLYAAVEGHPPFERDAAIATLTAVVIDEPEEAIHAGALWPVISALLRKDPDERLDPAEAERMLRRVADGDQMAPDPPADLAEPEAAAAAPANVAGPTGLVADQAAAATQAPVASPDATALAAVPGSVGPAERAPSSPPEESAPAAAAAPVPAAPSPRAASRRLRLPRRATLALAAMAAVAIIAVTLALTGSPGHPAASSGPSTRSTRDPAASPGASSPGGSTTPSAGGTGTGAPASPAASPGPGSGSSGGAADTALPAGYHRFTNSTGFSIGVPDGWQVSHVGHYVYVTDPSNGGIFLLIDQSDSPKSNPLADWEQQAANRADTYPDYHLIRLESVYYPQAEKAADWEFTYVRSGVPVHILNRNVLANAHHAYALYWSTPTADWDADFHYFQAFAGTFLPA